MRTPADASPFRRKLGERLWTYPFALAFAAALAGRLIDVRGVLVLMFFAVGCRAANRAGAPRLAIVSHVLMLIGAAGLFLHVWPGFDNPRVLHDVLLAPDSRPYTKYVNFDKGVAALFLLGIYAPDRPATDEGLRHAGAFAWRFVLLVATVIVLSLALGFVRWDPKLPDWWPVWLWSMVFFTALPEETLFRGVVQTAIERLLARSPYATAAAILGGGLLFGVAHAGGGVSYVILATVAGIGYGWIYASTRSIGAAIAAHAGLNLVHLVLFSYPALALHN